MVQKKQHREGWKGSGEDNSIPPSRGRSKSSCCQSSSSLGTLNRGWINGNISARFICFAERKATPTNPSSCASAMASSVDRVVSSEYYALYRLQLDELVLP